MQEILLENGDVLYLNPQNDNFYHRAMRHVAELKIVSDIARSQDNKQETNSD